MARKPLIDGTDATAGSPRSDRALRVRWSRALPGTVLAVAALTVPEFSVGAGDLKGGKGPADPLDPDFDAGRAQGPRMPSAAKVPLAGVRYGGMMAIREVTRAAKVERVASIASVDTAAPIAAAIAPLPKPSQPSRGMAERVGPPSDQGLDTAATYAMSVLSDFVAEGAVQPAATERLPAAPARLAKPAQIDVAASYVAMALDRLAESTVPGSISEPDWDAAAAMPVEAGDDNADSARLAAADIAPVSAIASRLAAPLDSPAADPIDDVAADLASAPVTPLSAAVVRDLGPAQPIALPPAASDPVASGPVAALAPAAVKAVPPAPVAARTAVAPAPAPKPVAAVEVPARAPAVAAAGTARLPLAFDLKSQLTTRVDGKTAGQVDFQQTTTGLSVRLGSIVSVLADRYDPGEIARITGSAASNAYITLAELQAQGIPISYDPVYDEFNIGHTDTRPKAARKVHIDQISTPERGLGTAAIDQVRR